MLKKGLYYNPTMLQALSVPVVPSTAHYHAIKQFLEDVEEIEPGVVEDLYKVAERFSEQVEQQIVDYYIGENRDLWSLIANSNDPDCVALTSGLLQWAKKWNLIDPGEKQKIYVAIALRAIVDFVNYSDGDEQTDERIVLTRSLRHYVSDSNSFDTLYPFVFSPSKLTLVTEDKAEWYEELWQRELARIYEHLWESRGKSVAEELKRRGVHTQDIDGTKNFNRPFKGTAWNPLYESWDDFEQDMDAAYQEYKNAYKMRMERNLESWGFKRSKEKKNLEHFSWFVRYQVYHERWSMRDIADEYSTDDKILTEDAVSKALHSIADLVLIPIRMASNGGRKRN